MTTAHRDAGMNRVEFLSIAEAAALYHVSRDYIRSQILNGTLPAVRSGHRIIRISSTDLERMFRPVQSMRSLWSSDRE